MKAMTDFLKHLADSFAAIPLWAMIVIALGSVVVGMFLMSVVAVELPADYFLRRRHAATGPWWQRFGMAILKNAAGAVVILFGVLLSLPGIPGPGLLTILIGLMLTDLPGVRWVVRSLLRRDSVRNPMNSLRRKFGKEPIQVE